MRLTSVFNAKLFLVCLVLHLAFLKSSAQGFARAQEIVSSFSNGNPLIGAVTADVNNNGYFVGVFSGTADFDPGSGVENLTATGDLDMFILKKDAAGNFLWVKHIPATTPNTGMCLGRGIALDSIGNIYISGLFQDDFDFDPGPGVQQFTSYGGAHSFVLKLDSFGNFVWVKDMGGQAPTAAMQIFSMKMDAASNIYFVVGYASNPPATIDVDPGPGIYSILCPSYGNDILIEKLDSAGNFVWAKQISGFDDQTPWALALDRLSNVYIAGAMKSTADFDPGSGIANLTSIGSGYDGFIAKYDSAGNYLWAKQISGAGDQVIYGAATDTFGNIFVTGYYEGISDFDPGPGFYNMTATSSDAFVLKLRNDGSFAWVNTTHSNGNGIGVATDGQGNVYTTGGSAPADFDPGPHEYWLSSAGYVQKLDSAGNFAWARGFGGEYPTAITIDHANDIYSIGRFNTPGDFDPGPGEFMLNGGAAGYIEKLCGTSLAVTASDSTPCAGDNVQLSTPAIPGAAFTWTMNGNVIAGNSNTITISQPGVYEVYVDGGCPNASGPLYIIDCTGVGETMKSTGVESYPNPAYDNITIETTLPNYTLTIINTLGQVVERSAESGSAVLDVSQYNPGIYYLRIETTLGQPLNRKFVVQH